MSRRFVDRTTEYEQRRARALDFEERTHDLAIEKRFRAMHGHTTGGFKAHLVRKVLTDFAIRDAERNSR